MTSDEVSQILHRLEDIENVMAEVKAEVVAAKAWQTLRDAEHHDALVRWQGRTDLFRWGYTLWRSDMTKWVIVAVGVLFARFA